MSVSVELAKERVGSANPKITVVMDWRDIPVEKSPDAALREWRQLGKRRQVKRSQKRS